MLDPHTVRNRLYSIDSGLTHIATVLKDINLKMEDVLTSEEQKLIIEAHGKLWEVSSSIGDRLWAKQANRENKESQKS